ncbi:hypothetical protein KUV51_02880 [Tateyamaria omphalii]|uniref:hypothetical protein n=1 Tax=Tateyamaria omphalii TaxID=299262 RepID=UPI001C99793C|nr:hypothetical protein [Tateyamaria omphalii]MBY5931934.1 hypothetical protein [Tateyamaria omphalii]
MTNPFPSPLELPASLPTRLDRVSVTLTYTARAVDKRWAEERLWLISEDAPQLETLLAPGFFRDAGNAPARVQFDQSDERTTTLTIAAPGMGSAIVTLLARYLVTLHAPKGVPDMQPDTALDTAQFQLDDGIGPSLPLVDQMAWPTDAGPMPRTSPAADIIIADRACIPLSGEAKLGYDFLDSFTQFASYGTLIPIGTDSGGIDFLDSELWLGHTQDDAPALMLENVAMEHTALAGLMTALVPDYAGPITLVEGE